MFPAYLSVCLSICLSVKKLRSALLCENGWTDQGSVWDEDSKCSIVLDEDPDPPRPEGKELAKTFWLLRTSRMAEVKSSKFCVHVDGWQS